MENINERAYQKPTKKKRKAIFKNDSKYVLRAKETLAEGDIFDFSPLRRTWQKQCLFCSYLQKYLISSIFIRNSTLLSQEQPPTYMRKFQHLASISLARVLQKTEIFIKHWDPKSWLTSS